MGSAVNQAPGGCQCGDCVGRICVKLSEPCHEGDALGVTIIAYFAGTESVAGSSTTDAGGNACVDNLDPGLYDVKARKGYDCSEVWWRGVNVSCSTARPEEKPIVCLPNGGWKFTVRGCFGAPLPGARVVVAGPLGSGSIGETDANGEITLMAIETGATTATITHPSGRFKAYSTTWNQATLCASGVIPPIQLPVADDYICCEIILLADPPSPYPIPRRLKAYDNGGLVGELVDCGAVEVCVSREMTDVAQGPVTFGACSDGGTSWFPPTIGGGTTRVKYSIGMGGLPEPRLAATQTIPEVFVNGTSWYMYLHGGYATGRCKGPVPEWVNLGFRVPVACGGELPVWGSGMRAADRDYASDNFTINSFYPFSATIHFPAGNGFGPYGWNGVGTDVPTGDPYSSSLVISE